MTVMTLAVIVGGITSISREMCIRDRLMPVPGSMARATAKPITMAIAVVTDVYKRQMLIYGSNFWMVTLYPLFLSNLQREAPLDGGAFFGAAD